MGSFFFFFPHTPPFLCSLSGPGGCEWWAGPPVGVWAVGFFSSAAAGDRGGLPVPRRSEGGSAPGLALTTPLGVVVPGSRSIECIWGVWVGVPVSIFVCLHVGRWCVYSFACMRVGTFACVYGCLFVYVYVSGRALDSTSLIISVDPHPTTMPCRWRMPPVRWWFPRAGAGCSGERRPTLAVAWRGLALLALLGPDWGWGAFGSPGPGPGLPWCGRLPVEPAGLPPRHPGASTLWLSEVTPSGSPLPFSGWRPRLSLRWFSWGSRVLGGPRMFGGPDLFHACFMPCGMGLFVPHTHY